MSIPRSYARMKKVYFGNMFDLPLAKMFTDTIRYEAGTLQKIEFGDDNVLDLIRKSFPAADEKNNDGAYMSALYGIPVCKSSLCAVDEIRLVYRKGSTWYVRKLKLNFI